MLEILIYNIGVKIHIVNCKNRENII